MMEKDMHLMIEALKLVELFLTSDGEDEEMWEAETLAAVRQALERGKRYE